MSHYDFFDATRALSTDLTFDHTPCFNRDTHVLQIYVSGKRITLDVRSLLHHAGCIDRQSRKGTTKLAVRQGRFAGIEQRDDEFVAVSGRTVIGSFSNVTDAALARARWDAQHATSSTAPARQSDRKRRRVDYSESRGGDSEDDESACDEDPKETREFVQARQNAMWRMAMAADRAAEVTREETQEFVQAARDDSSDVEIVGASTRERRNAVGYSSAIDVDAL
jgi:hypothetical protein